MVMAMVAILMIASGSTQAALITNVPGAAGSTELDRADLIIDNSGLSGPPYTEASTHGNANSIGYLSWADQYPWVAIDLGANYDLTDAYIWNYTRGGWTYRGMIDIDIYVNSSVVGTNWTLVVTNHTLTEGTGSGAETSQNVTLTASDVRRVKIQAKTVPAANDTYTGLAEVKFHGTLSASQDTTQIITPTNATASSQYSTYSPTLTIDSSDFFGTNNIADATVNIQRGWLSDSEDFTDKWIMFELDQEYDIGGALIWNNGDNTATRTYRGVKKRTSERPV